MKELHRSLPAKVGAIFLTVVFGVLGVLSALGIAVCWEEDLYDGGSDYLSTRSVVDLAQSRLMNIAFDLEAAQSQGVLSEALEELPRSWGASDTNLRFSVSQNGVYLGSSTSGPAANGPDPLEDEETARYSEGDFDFAYLIDPAFPVRDDFSRFFLAYRIFFPLRWWLIALVCLNVLGFFAALVFLCCAAGWRRSGEYPQFNAFDRIPLDLWLVIALAAAGLLLVAMGSFFTVSLLSLALCGVLAIVLWLVVLATLLTLCTRFKVGKWWRNTIVWRVWRLICRLITGIGRGVSGMARALPAVWRTALFSAGVFLLSLFITLLGGGWWSSGALLLYLMLGAALCGFACVCAFQLQTLRRSAHAMAEGTLDAGVDTRRMLPAFRSVGEDLNSLGQGLSIAVEQRLRSERLRTELITNVSHDIKTPLTSIINYVDLMQKPHSDEEGAHYLSVLDRQARRLKKLTEDLVEASKASTGNLPVSLVPTDLHEILTQAAGEYEDKLAEARLELVPAGETQHISAMADGRLLWRVLDNLLNNVCKYALAGTRVYLETRRCEGRAVITVKNVSRQQLNVSPDELMERFVRGDSARNTEGSGLGLNIAQSLVELMLGKFSLEIDGDLFKAVISLPLSPNDHEKELTEG